MRATSSAEVVGTTLTERYTASPRLHRTEKGAVRADDFRDHLDRGKLSGDVDAQTTAGQHAAPSVVRQTPPTTHDALMQKVVGSVSPIGVGSLPGTAGGRVFLQHWYANGYLSVIPLSAETLVTSSASVRTSKSAHTLSWNGNESVGVCVCEPDQSAESTRRVVSLAGSEWSVPAVASSTQSNDEYMLRGSVRDCSAVLFWPERLLWQSRSRDGSTTLWLRDYALRGSARDAAIAGYLRLSDQMSSTTLGRIMINGRQAWSRSSTGSISR